MTRTRCGRISDRRSGHRPGLICVRRCNDVIDHRWRWTASAAQVRSAHRRQVLQWRATWNGASSATRAAVSVIGWIIAPGWIVHLVSPLSLSMSTGKPSRLPDRRSIRLVYDDRVHCVPTRSPNPGPAGSFARQNGYFLSSPCIAFMLSSSIVREVNHEGGRINVRTYAPRRWPRPGVPVL